MTSNSTDIILFIWIFMGGVLWILARHISYREGFKDGYEQGEKDFKPRKGDINMDKIIAFIMTHPDVTVEIKKNANFYQSIDIKMRKNNAKYREILGENRLTGLESILAYMYDVVSSKERGGADNGRNAD